MDVIDAIRNRRSIRKYTTDPVADADLETVLDAARWAPSWANTQCIRWVVVRDPDTKEKLADTLPHGNPAGDAMRTVPVVLVSCAETGRAGFKSAEPVTDKDDTWYMFDAASAAQNLMLAALELGLGTVHVGLFDAERAGQIVGVPENVRVVELIPLGHPTADPPRNPRRKELKELVFRDKYGRV